MAQTLQKPATRALPSELEATPEAEELHPPLSPEKNGTPVLEVGSRLGAAILEAADPGTCDHSDDVELLAEQLCAELKINGNSRQDMLVAARLHDIGKVAIPREIIDKPGPLDEKEWDVIKEHTATGERILRSVPELSGAALLVRHSHEHYDGKGYPDGLSGEEIPIGSRVILCADAFHAIRSDRPYRKGRSRIEAMKEMQRCAGSQFDPEVVAALTKLTGRSGSARRGKLPRRLAILLSALAIGTGGAYAAEQGWIPSPIPGIGPSEKESGGGDSSGGSGAEQTGSGTESGSTDGEAGGASGSGAEGTGSRSGDAKDGGGAGKSGDGTFGGDAKGSGTASGDGTKGAAGDGGGGNAGGSGDGAQESAGSAGAGGESSGGGAGGSSPGPEAGTGGDSGSVSGGGSGGGGSPGNSGSAPGQSGSTPGQSGSNPGSGGAPPGQAGTAPGLSGAAPGQSGTPPGQSGGAPGNSGNAPGRGGPGGNPHG